MDTSEKYIKMCEKAEEIQKNHKWEYADFFVLVRPQHFERIVFLVWNDNMIIQENEIIVWLPRQDQLQEMANTKWPWPMYLFRFYEFIQQEYLYNAEEWKPIADYSMEQLWLAFVMKEKFGKTWDDEKGEMIS